MTVAESRPPDPALFPFCFRIRPAPGDGPRYPSAERLGGGGETRPDYCPMPGDNAGEFFEISHSRLLQSGMTRP
jgi:hypothetical protein